MKHILTISISSLLLISLNSHIQLTQCHLSESISSESSESPSPSPSLSPQRQPSSYSEDAFYPFAPEGGPFTMQDADGDPINLPTDSSTLFNPFTSQEKQEEKEIQSTEFDPSVKKVCEGTDNPELCLTSLKPFLTKHEDKKDGFSLLEMEVKATIEATTSALSLANKDLSSPKAKNPDMAALKDCRETYVDAMKNLEEALGAIKTKDLGTASSLLSATISDFGTCDDGFKESASKSPMNHYGGKLSDMVSNCLAMISSIRGTNEDEEA